MRSSNFTYAIRSIGFGLFAFVVALLMSGCYNGVYEKNPFVGSEWKSDVASDGTSLSITANIDGTFTYTMNGVPAEMGLPNSGKGAYLIDGDLIVSYFDFGMTKSNIFKIVDKNTIAMTEVTLGVNGAKTLGETVNFRRVQNWDFDDMLSSLRSLHHTFLLESSGRSVMLDNPLLGKWEIDFTYEGVRIFASYDMRDDGKFGFRGDMGGIVEEGVASYAIFDNTLIVYDSDEGVEVSTFEVLDENTIKLIGEAELIITRVVE